MDVDRFSRTFDVLELLVGHSGGMTLTEIGRRLELPTSSTHNLLQRMVGVEIVSVTEDLRYSIGPRAVRLGIRVVDSLEVRGIAHRFLQELARETGEDVYLAVRLGRRVAYVDRLQGNRLVTVDIRLGQSLFLHATSVGKLFAAHVPAFRRRVLSEARPRVTENTLIEPGDIEAELDRIEEDGYAVSREEAILGVVGLAVPVFDAGGVLIAAIHISALRAQLTEEREHELVTAALDAAVAIETELGRTEGARTTAATGSVNLRRRAAAAS